MTNEEILKFIQLVRNDKTNTFYKKQIGQIYEANDDRGNSYNGSKVFLISYDINHIFKSHGQSIDEEKRGQIPIIDTDFIILKDVIPEINQFTFKGQTRLRLDLILTKYIDDIAYYFTFEVRPKYKDLILKTMYKRKK